MDKEKIIITSTYDEDEKNKEKHQRRPQAKSIAK